jgi:hypothetical protein
MACLLICLYDIIFRRDDSGSELYDETGPFRGVSVPALLAWAAGAVFFAMGSIGGTIPALAV